jgi:hypothetical protein
MNSRTSRLVILLVSLSAVGNCQAQQPGALTNNIAFAGPSDLPDAPSPVLDPSNSDPSSDAPSPTAESSVSSWVLGVAPQPGTGIPARKFHRVVQPYEVGQPLNSADKLKLSIISRLTMSDVASTAFSAGRSQIRDSSPHYGTDSGAFGDRLGALALKQTMQSIFSYGIFASVFHDDPRYYVMGTQKNVGLRALYSASRLAITQTDDGKVAINLPKFAGIASATALTEVYYPAQDRGLGSRTEAFGESLWTSILNNEIHEFIGDGLRLMRHRQN